MTGVQTCALPIFLRGLTGLDMYKLDLLLNAPGQEVPIGQLRADVTANRSRLSAMFDDLVQHTCHPPTGEGPIHFQCQALPRVGINHAQHADRPAGSDRILRKIQNPLLVGGSVLTKRCALLEEVFALPPAAPSRLLDSPGARACGSRLLHLCAAERAAADIRSAASPALTRPDAHAVLRPNAELDIDNSTPLPSKARTLAAGGRRSAVPSNFCKDISSTLAGVQR